MASADLTILVTVTRRPWWRRALLSPRLFVRHYQTMRRTADPVAAAYGAYLLMTSVFTFFGSPKGSDHG